MIGRILDLWDSIPTWIKWPIAIIIVPNLVVTSLIFFIWGVPWFNSAIDARIMPLAEKRDLKIQAIVREQTMQFETVNTSLQRIEQHQAIMYQALLERKTAQK
jgi:hypothetical protein